MGSVFFVEIRNSGRINLALTVKKEKRKMRLCHTVNRYYLWTSTGGGGGDILSPFNLMCSISMMRMYDFLRYQEYKLDTSESFCESLSFNMDVKYVSLLLSYDLWDFKSFHKGSEEDI